MAGKQNGGEQQVESESYADEAFNLTNLAEVAQGVARVLPPGRRFVLITFGEGGAFQVHRHGAHVTEMAALKEWVSIWLTRQLAQEQVTDERRKAAALAAMADQAQETG